MSLFKFGLKTLKSFIEKKSLNSEAWHILEHSCLRQDPQHFELISTSSCLNRKRQTTRKSGKRVTNLRKLDKVSLDRTFKQNNIEKVSAIRNKVSKTKIGKVEKGNDVKYPITTDYYYGFRQVDKRIKSPEGSFHGNNAQNVPGSGNNENIGKLNSGKQSPKSEKVKGNDAEHSSTTNNYGFSKVDKGIKAVDGTFKENNEENVPGFGNKETIEKLKSGKPTPKTGKFDNGQNVEFPNYLNNYEKLLRAENVLEAKFFMKSSDDSSDSNYSAVGKGKAAKMMTKVEVQRASDKFFVKFGEAVAFVEIEESDDTMTIKKTEVPEAFRGKRIAAQLARHALDYAKNNNLRVKLDCDYVKDFIRLHAQEYEDIVER